VKRQCLTSLVTAAAVIAALTVPGSAAAYAAPGWITAQLTTGSLGNSQVQVSGDRVVWRGFDGMHNQIFTYKVGVDTSPVRLTSDANEHESPQVSGDRVVWQAFDGAHEQVFTRKVGVDPSAIQLTTHPQNSFEPHVSGDRVV